MRTPAINWCSEISLFKMIAATGSTRLRLIKIKWTKIKIFGVIRATKKNHGPVKLITCTHCRNWAATTWFHKANRWCRARRCSPRRRAAETTSRKLIRIYRDCIGSTRWTRRNCTRTNSCNWNLKSGLRIRTRLPVAWLSPTSFSM